MVGVHLQKHRPRNAATSAFTEGFLLSNAAMTSSWIASKVVCEKKNEKLIVCYLC